MKKILVTGGKGQLGMDCVRVMQRAHDVVAVDLDEADIAQSFEVDTLIKTFAPDIILNCAAYTHVDKCETDRDAAWNANVKGPENLALGLQRQNGLLVHISTDYVFDGDKKVPEPYLETDAPHPLSYYGTTKYHGEKKVRHCIERYVIVRTAWLYGIDGGNFLKTILQLALRDPERTIKVINDQFGSPTWSFRLARQIQAIIDAGEYGIFHATAEGYCTWYELAACFLARMAVPHSIVPCATEEYPTAAKRPHNSILENRNLKAKGINVMPNWREDVARFVDEYRDRLLHELG